MRPSVLFISEKTLKERTVISDNIDSKILRQCIEAVQEEKILPALGSALYNRLIDAITNTNLTSDESLLLDDYVSSCMKWFVLAELPLAIGVKYYNRNILRKTGDNSENVSMSELYDVMNYYKNKAEFQIERMIGFLKQNASGTKYTQYLNPGNGYDTVVPKKRAYSCPIVLNDSIKWTDVYGNPINPNGNNY
jgi:hypothetical protein